MSKKKTAKKAPAKKSTKSAAKKTTAKAAKKAAAAKATAKKTTKKTTKKAPAKKAAAKKATGTGAKRASATTKSAAAKKQAAPAATRKASSKSSTKKATAKKHVARSKTAPDQDDSAPVIPPEADYLRDKKWLASQREALLRERASYTSSADRLAAEAAALMADREPGDVQFDEESGEGDTIAVERDRDLALSAAARQSVAEIDAALTRLENNTYGICIEGNDIIPRERLEAIPEASVCVTHKTSMF